MQQKHTNTLTQFAPKKGSLRSFKEQRQAERKEIAKDTSAFVKLTMAFMGVFVAVLLVPIELWQRIDNVNPLVAAITTTLVFVLVTIKLIVGKRKMW